jgi:hypothetical protein
LFVAVVGPIAESSATGSGPQPRFDLALARVHDGALGQRNAADRETEWFPSLGRTVTSVQERRNLFPAHQAVVERRAVQFHRHRGLRRVKRT